MANHLRLATLLLSLLLLVSSSSARLLMLSFSLAATQPTFNNIALPTDAVNGPEKKAAPRHVMPCHMEATTAGESSSEVRVRDPTVSRNYGPLVLNMLPKNVPVPPSGPSGKIHDVQN